MLGTAANDDDDLKKLDDVPLLTPENDGDFQMLQSSRERSVLNIRIKSFQDFDVKVPSNSNVSQLKDLVRQTLGPQSQDRYLRLICKGRLLHPETSPLSEFKVHNNDVVHAVLAAPGVGGPTERVTSVSGGGINSGSSGDGNGGNRRRRGGTIVGPGGRVTRAPTNGEDSSSEDDDDDEEQGRERMGFDRLRLSGLSRQEITAIRTYFSRHVDRHIERHSQEHQDESDLRRRRLLFEEDWMSVQGPTSEFRLNLNNNVLMRFASGSVETNWRASLGTDRDFMWGFALGFFVGFVMLVWVWMPTVPHKQKIGILTGISFQLAMNVLRQDNDEEVD
mmetsp:Transcript_4560/g.8430  ORF Transcript_4560/g.8430 Transcript_4560/m.8430 type:complete len:334 (-) Transcript_4560:2640-3641(-)